MNKDSLHKILFFITLFLFCIAISFISNTPDYDLWARLIVGKSIVESGTILTKDFISYTPTHFWYDHEWGSSFIFYLVFKYFSDFGLVFLKGSLIFSIIYFINQTVKIKSDKTTSPYNILFYIFVFISFYTILSATIRCHLFTFLFFTIWIYLLERYRLGRKKQLYILPVLMIFWCNIHGGCLSGLGLLVIYAIGEFLNKKNIKDYVSILALTFGAMFINPYGPKYVLFLLKATTMDRPYITEWKSTFHHRYMFNYLKFKLFLLIMSATVILKAIKDKINYDKIDKTKLILLLTTAILAINHVKHQPFFVITAAIFLYDDFYYIFNAFIKNVNKLFHINSQTFIKAFVTVKETLVYSFILFICFVTFKTTDATIKISQIRYPIYAIEFVKLNDLKGNLFINFDYGSYAGYKLYPDNLIEIDGRYEEVYSGELLEEVKNFHLAKTKNWDKIIKDYRTDVIIIEKKYPVFNKLKEDKKWAMVFNDKDFAVFVPANKSRKNYMLPPIDDEYYNKTKFETNIRFQKL